MRILQVIPDLRKGGAERLVLDICIELKSRGHDVKLVNFRTDNTYSFLSENIEREVIPAFFHPSITSEEKKSISHLEKFIEDFKPDILHSHLFEAEIVTRQIIFPGIKYFTHLHDNMPQFQNLSLQTFFSKKELANFYEKTLMLKQYRKCNNNFIAISNHTAAYFRNALPGDLQKIHVLNNAVDVKRFLRNSPPPGKDPFRLVTTGSLVPKKNQIFLVEVMKTLREKKLNIHLHILGDGPQREKIQQKINEYNLNDCITLHGSVEKVEDFLHRAHVYVHSATYEPFGLVLLEAMAAGLPCVMLDGCGNRDIAVDGKNCFFIKTADPVPFSEKTELLYRNSELYKNMSDYCVYFAQKFDISNYVEKLLKIYGS